MYSNHDRELLRRLAGEVAEAAHTERNQKLRERWIRHNAMRDDEPMILAFFENSWKEVMPEETLEAEDPELREIERDFRQKLYQFHTVRDDAVIEPVYRMKASYDDHFDFQMGTKKVESGVDGGSYVIDPVICSDEDVRKLMSFDNDWIFDDAGTAAHQERLSELFGDLLPVWPSIPFYTASIVFQLVPLYGLTELMCDLLLEPERIHTIMGFLSESIYHAFKRIEREKRIISNNNGIFLPSGSFGFSDELKNEKEGPFTFSDLWGFADTQEFTDVGADMWREFVLPYQRKLLDLFGLVYYGCCEKMDEKWEDVLAIPNIRKVSVSPWSDIRIAAEQIGRKAVYCRKVNPAQVIYQFDADKTAKDLKELQKVTKDCLCEVVLKDLHTLDGHPEHVAEWVRLARKTMN